MPPQWKSSYNSGPGTPFGQSTGSNGRSYANGDRRAARGFRPRAERRQAEAERATRLALMDCYNG